MRLALTALCLGLYLLPAPADGDEPPRLASRSGVALAVGDDVPPAPVVPPIAPPPVAPVAPSPSTPPLDEPRIIQLIEQALDRRCGAQASPQAAASPQMTSRSHARVLVPAGPVRRALGTIGEHLARLKQPHARVLPLAPAAEVRASSQH